MANEVVKKYYEWDQTGETFNLSINYDAGENCGPVAGITLKGGYLKEVNGQKLVYFDKAYKGKPVGIKYDNKPDLAALVAEYEKIQEEQSARRKEKWAAKKAVQDAIDNPLLEAMRANAAKLHKQIPAGHIEVEVKDNGDFDGYPNLDYFVNDVKLHWSKVNNIGVASAIRPGALGSFARIYVVSIAKTEFDQIKKEQETKKTADQSRKEARQKELAETVIPPQALAAYNDYAGDADKAWENEDEAAWALIERWTPYIEAQHGIAPCKLQRMISESMHEENYGINEG